ncbi:Drug/Metabolite Transporter (DMT) Superfamily [Pseudoloma neurophilia]|uniref:Drug/Metabolite Transporter (DMT) Superfamily n=1 Tax=Pseudoloma neurophilia TaxID=146866 RepID=A0A0R0M3V6_9MICR|nr:Drug/Metabolite Transporter (DMT) Superfamily [Pseudoloma neurophilia]
MKKYLILVCIISFAISVSSGLAKNKLCTKDFIKMFPLFTTSFCGLILSAFFARKYELPNRFLSGVVLLLIFYGILLWYSIKNIKVFTISLFAPSKLIFTCFLIKTFGSLKLKKIQYLALFLILLGVLLPILWSIKSKNRVSMPISHALICLASGMCFALANFSYEVYQKNFNPYLWDIIFSGCITALPITAFFFVLEMLKAHMSFQRFLHQPNLIWITFATYLELGSKAIVLLMVNTIFRSIVMLLQSVSIGLVDSIFFSREFRPIDLLAFLLANLGLLIYDYRALKNIFHSKKVAEDKKDDVILKTQVCENGDHQTKNTEKRLKLTSNI